MDAQVSKSLDALLKAVKESREYTEYMQARQLLIQDPDRRARTEAFRRKNYLIQNTESEQMSTERIAIYKDREELRRDPVIDRYLNTELVLCRLLRNLSLELLNVAELDLEFMEDIL